MTNIVPDEDGFTELVDPSVPRVDLVGIPANGVPGWLLMKQDAQAGLMSPDAIRALIGKTAATPEPESTLGETVTMTGSPAAIAKMIHEASLRREAASSVAVDLDLRGSQVPSDANIAELADRVLKAAASAKEQNDLPDSDFAYIEPGGSKDEDGRTVPRSLRHFPINDEAHVRNALSRAPQSPFGDKAMPSIRAAAKKFGIDVAKEALMDDDLDPMTALAEADGDAPGMDTDPGSPAWEAVDAATARKWTSILARAKAAVDMLADRELMEAAAGDDGDAENAWDLQDACCALDYAISVLAPFAVAEQAEADCCDDMQTVGKALAGFDTAALDTVEALGHVRKAGRVLSAGNEAAIRGAVDSLQKVLASLPAAPTTDEAGAPVAKTANEEPDMPTPTLSEDVTEASGQEPAMGTQQADPKPVAGQAVTDMAKADGDKPEMVAVFNASGKLVGIVDPDKITMVSGASADEDTKAEPEADAGDEAATPETTDLTPAPAAEVGTPADAVPDDEAVTKSTPDTTLTDMFKSSLLAAVESAFTEHSAAQNTVLAKQSDVVLELAGMVETLKGRIGALEEQPAEPRVFTNGAVPPRDLRGMDRGAAAQVDVAKAREQKDQLYKARNATEQNRIAQDMQAGAIAALQAIHQGGARQ